MFDVRRLRVLRAVAEHGTFAAAAADLAYTPSAVSQQIAALEREAGTVLVERGSRGARLTQAGAVLDRHAGAVLGQLAAARAELDGLQELRSGSLSLAAFKSAWQQLVPLAVAAFRDAHPEIRLDLGEEDPAVSIAAVREGARDVALVFEPHGVDVLDGLVREPVCDDPLRAVLPAGHALAGAERLDLAGLAGDPWVAPTAHCAGVVRRACAAAGFVPEIVFTSDDYGAIQGFVAAGVGVALVPQLALARTPGTVARPVGGRPPSRTLAAITAPLPVRPAATEAMLGALRAAAAELGAQPAAAQP